MKVISSYIAPDVHIEGEITCEGPARIDGECHGLIQGNHEITIGTFAKIHGKVNAQSIVVNGKIMGNVAAVKKITLLADGDVKGDFYTPPGGLNIKKGGNIEGSFYIGVPKGHLPGNHKN
ncbi:polymer-forming cytoskeletal protein [Deltaproteobacteria bacterium TL4]